MSDSFVELKNLSKSFNKGESEINVLKDVSLGIKRGEMIALLGASGAGKSTLLHILGGLDRPSAGSVIYGGRDIYNMGEKPLSDFRNKEIGFVFQSHHLLPEFSALENVMMPALIGRMKRDEAARQAHSLLEKVGLSERTSHKPGELSGGEQQRVALARALVLAPDVLLADEPTGNLDSKTGDEVFSLMVEMNRSMGLTFVMVTHNEKLAVQVDRQIRVQDGRIIF
ncbi:MAG: ABC transporter ATP-binding protein [Proteobacteria bacterium]|nr:ABC transporter ATP-binding protein [Pseudomonadota bacterium]